MESNYKTMAKGVDRIQSCGTVDDIGGTRNQPQATKQKEYIDGVQSCGTGGTHSESAAYTLFTANISLPIKLAQQWVEFPQTGEFPTSLLGYENLSSMN